MLVDDDLTLHASGSPARRDLVMRVGRTNGPPAMPTSTNGVPAPARQVIREAGRAVGYAEAPRTGHVGLRHIVRLTAEQAGPHHVPAFARNLAYNAFLASLPLLLFLVAAGSS